ncbi:MAG: hypothetical protein AAF934_06715 [Bacteroidota bacterium]
MISFYKTKTPDLTIKSLKIKGAAGVWDEKLFDPDGYQGSSFSSVAGYSVVFSQDFIGSLDFSCPNVPFGTGRLAWFILSLPGGRQACRRVFVSSSRNQKQYFDCYDKKQKEFDNQRFKILFVKRQK